MKQTKQEKKKKIMIPKRVTMIPVSQAQTSLRTQPQSQGRRKATKTKTKKKKRKSQRKILLALPTTRKKMETRWHRLPLLTPTSMRWFQ